MEQITVRLPERAMNALRAEAEKTGIPPAILIRHFVLQALAPALEDPHKTMDPQALRELDEQIARNEAKRRGRGR